MFLYRHAAVSQALLLTLLVAACSVLQARASFALAIVRLYGERVLQQKMDLGVNGAKAALAGALTLFGMSASLALGMNVAAAAVTWSRLRHWLATRLPPLQPDGAYHAQLLDMVRRQAPNSVYYCASGQIAIWLVGLMGSTQGIAQVGALGRIAVLFTIIGAVVSAIVQPYFARHNEPRTLKSAFVAVNAFFALTALTLWAGARTFPGPVLWILGGAYRGLDEAVPWMVLTSCLSVWSGAVYSIGGARGWLVPSGAVIATGVLATAASIVWLDVSTPSGSFQMGTVTAGTAVVLTLGYVGHRLHVYAHRAASMGKGGSA